MKQKLVSEGRVFGPFFGGLKKIKGIISFYSELAKPKKNQRIIWSTDPEPLILAGSFTIPRQASSLQTWNWRKMIRDFIPNLPIFSWYIQPQFFLKIQAKVLVKIIFTFMVENTTIIILSVG